MIEFVCSHCKESLEAPLSLEGQQLVCPGCGREEAVPLRDDRGEYKILTPEEIEIVEQASESSSGNDQSHIGDEEIEANNGPRLIFINTEGEVIMTNYNKSVQCPIRQERCRCSCAWFSIDHDLEMAYCQSSIKIGHVTKNEYGKKDSGQSNRWI